MDSGAPRPRDLAKLPLPEDQRRPVPESAAFLRDIELRDRVAASRARSLAATIARWQAASDDLAAAVHSSMLTWRGLPLPVQRLRSFLAPPPRALPEVLASALRRSVRAVRCRPE